MAALSAACGPHPQLIDAVSATNTANDAVVAALENVQALARLQRSHLAMLLAMTAPHIDDWNAAVAKLDAQYAGVWDALRAAEDAQHSLATAIVSAQFAIRHGYDPNLTEVMQRFVAVTMCNGDVMAALARIRP